ncbi:MAG: Gfo/Idh/MocA family oxidoreductase [Mycobacteriales bacterium]
MRTIGLVGTGLMGGHHTWALQALAKAGLIDAQVTVVHDLDSARAQAFADEHVLHAARDLADLVDRVDVVWITTWTSGHLEPAAAAAAAGKAVFVEKPLAPTLDQCEELAAVLRGVPHQVGLILRHAPAYALLAGLVHSGRFGRPMAALFRDDQRFPLDGPYGSTWRADVERAGGGTLIEHSVHDVDVLIWLLGTPVAASAHTTAFAGKPGIEDMAQVRLEFAGGHSAALTSVWHRVEGRTTNRRLEVFCEDGVLWMDGEVGPVNVETSAGIEQLAAPFPALLDGLGLEQIPETWREAAAGLALQAKAFLDGLDAGVAGWPSVDDALVAHRAVDAAYRSAAGSGAAIRCS